MSLRRLNKIAFQVVVEIVQRLKNTNAFDNFGRIGLKILKQNRQTFRRTIFKGIRVVARQPNQLWRPFSSLHFRHQHQLNQIRNGLFYIKEDKHRKDVLQSVRHLFGTNARYNRSLSSNKMPEYLEGYEIGDFIASGCNGAVFQLRLRNDLNNNNNEVKHDSCKNFPLALKVMFIDDLSTPEQFIWKEMCSELIPLVSLRKKVYNGKFARIKPLSRSHPNIIKMYTAFTDRISALPQAEKLLHQRLQKRFATTYQNNINLDNNSKTLYLVMKRYRMTLQTYLKSCKRNYFEARILFGQLMEAIVFLHKNKICHRDMKSDNILLDFDFEDEVPHLVLSDFGSALSQGDWILHSSSDGEFSDLGGNLALRAPEIRRINSGLNSFIDYEMADTWAAGTLAYEIFTRRNPFYAILSSATYKETELPPLPTRLINPIKIVINQMLSIDPKNRPKPEIVANVLALSLFGINIKKFLEKFTNEVSNKLGNLIRSIAQLYASETILGRYLNPKPISNAELQLRATFLSRIGMDDLNKSLNYYINDSKQNYGSLVNEISTKYNNCGEFDSIYYDAFSSAVSH